MTQGHRKHAIHHSIYLVVFIVTALITVPVVPSAAAEDADTAEATNSATQSKDEKPVVVITTDNTTAGRTLSGTVSRSDVTLQVTVDGAVTTLNPVVTPALAADTNTDTDTPTQATWTVSLPDSITDGTHTVSVVATTIIADESESESLVSEPVTATITVATPTTTPQTPVVTPTTPSKIDDDSDLIVATTTQQLSVVPEIGQFVAPEIPASPLQVKKQLYGVPVDDLVQTDQATIATDAALDTAKNASGSVLGVDTVGRQESAQKAVVHSSSSGWMLFGVAWYWVIIAVVSIVIAVSRIRYLVRRAHNHRRPELQTRPVRGMINQYD